jgi:hypothetical protein
MELVKKNIVSIVCGVIAIAAVVVYFVWVSGSLYPDLQAQAKTRQSNYDTLVNLMGKTRNLPVVSLKTSDPVPLPSYPTVPVIDKAKKVTGALSGQSKEIMNVAVQMNARPPLVNVFPNLDDNKKFAFRDAYAEYFDKALPERLVAAKPPTLEDVAAAEQKLWDEKFAPRIHWINGVEANRESIDQEYQADVANLRDVLQKQTAETHRVYLDSTAVTTNTALWKTESSPPTPQVWFAQTALWVQTDVLDSIAALNNNVLNKLPKPQQNIINAPVKHIVELSIPQGADQFIRITDTTKEDLAAGMEDFTSSPTGRTSGSVYDVIRFKLVVKMDATYVAALIQELSRGKFVTVHDISTLSVDTALARQDGFFYGDSPVVQATINGEALLLREWTNKLCPEVVKKDLPGAPPPAEGEKPAGPVASR